MVLPPRGTGDNIVRALVRKGCRCIVDQYGSHISSRTCTISTCCIQQPDGEARTFQTFLFAIFPAAFRPEVHSRARTQTLSSPGSPKLVAGVNEMLQGRDMGEEILSKAQFYGKQEENMLSLY